MNTTLCMGMITLDILSYVDGYPHSNEKKPAVEQRIYAGGPATNGAVACAALGSKTTLLTGIGKHPLSSLLWSDLRRHGVQVIDILAEGLDQEPPVISNITVDIGTGDRSVVYASSSHRTLKKGTNYPELLAGVSLILLDGHFSDTALDLAAIAKSMNIPIVLDGGSWKHGMDQLLPFVQYAICSADFYPPGCNTTQDVLDCIQEAGVMNAAVSRGGNSIIAVSGTRTYEVPAVTASQVVDSLGAGDILHGAFCHFISRHEFVASLEKAAGIATHSCSFRGTRSWIQHLDCTSPREGTPDRLPR